MATSVAATHQSAVMQCINGQICVTQQLFCSLGTAQMLRYVQKPAELRTGCHSCRPPSQMLTLSAPFLQGHIGLNEVAIGISVPTVLGAVSWLE